MDDETVNVRRPSLVDPGFELLVGLGASVASIWMVEVFPREAATTAVLPSCFIIVTGGTNSICAGGLGVIVGVMLLDTCEGTGVEVTVVNGVVVVALSPSSEPCTGVGVTTGVMVNVESSTGV
jgi:hypothetical protein